MNYLAHIFLSGHDKSMQTGGFIADFVKGKKAEAYPEAIRRGIQLHREIDAFTDSHEVVRELVRLLRPAFGRYSGIVADMYLDHFLALHFNKYTQISLGKFSRRFYFAAIVRYRHLPPRVKRFIFHFISTNRLKKYSTVDGLKESLLIMAAYKISALNPEEIILFLEGNYAELEALFHKFFPDVVGFAKTYSLKEIRP